MAMKDNYVYPISPPTDREPSLAPPHRCTDNDGEMADEPSPSAISSSNQPQSAVRRARSPPRNAQGEIVCDHPSCRNKAETFRRLCEWNKHMDRHERPYKCHENGCELSPGFTYSGGLLRHQREVHKMHLSTKQPLYCPIPNCNRSSGAGFTRKENLEEHKRRRHVGELPDTQPRSQSRMPMSPSTGSSVVPLNTMHQPLSKKRRRQMTPHDMEEDDEAGVDFGQTQYNVSDPNETPIVKRLRLELAQKDEYIRRQTMELQRLQNLIRALPPQTIYGIMPLAANSHLGQ